MKKMFVLSIVFAVTSLSSAGMVLQGPDTIELGDTVNMAIVSDLPNLYLSGIVSLNPPYNAAGDALSNVELYPEPPIAPPYPDLPHSFRFDLIFGVWDPPVDPGTPVVTFDLTNSGTPLGGTITIDLLDLASGSFSTHHLEVVPEPSSMLLLGLGAMVLRRLQKNKSNSVKC